MYYKNTDTTHTRFTVVRFVPVVVCIDGYEGIGLNRFGGTVVDHSPPAALLPCVMVAAAAAAAVICIVALARAKRLTQTHGKARAASQSRRGFAAEAPDKRG